jgi:hypothetical protein
MASELNRAVNLAIDELRTTRSITATIVAKQAMQHAPDATEADLREEAARVLHTRFASWG